MYSGSKKDKGKANHRKEVLEVHIIPGQWMRQGRVMQKGNNMGK